MKHEKWMSAAELEYQRSLEMLAGLTAQDWQRPTDCDEWDVRQVLAHLVGGTESTSSLRELRRLQKRGRKLRPGVDGMNDIEVRERAGTSPSQLLTDLASAAERGLRARRRIPAPVRVLRIPFGPPLGVRSVGYLMDRVYTRDAWIHRIDIARATARPLVLTPGHDGRLADDIVQEWAHVHGQPYDLTLTGPAGGRWSKSPAGQRLTLDAVQFCRILSGRAAGEACSPTRSRSESESIDRPKVIGSASRATFVAFATGDCISPTRPPANFGAGSRANPPCRS